MWCTITFAEVGIKYYDICMMIINLFIIKHNYYFLTVVLLHLLIYLYYVELNHTEWHNSCNKFSTIFKSQCHITFMPRCTDNVLTPSHI